MKKIENMSLAELLDLQDSIKKQIEELGGRTYKCELISCGWFEEEFGEELREKGVTNEYWYYGWDKKILGLCDLTFQNYKVASTKGKKCETSVYMNGSVLAPEINPKLYAAMIEDIKQVIKKYHAMNKKEVAE